MPRLHAVLLCTAALLAALPAQRQGQGQGQGRRGGFGRPIEAPKLEHFTYEAGALQSKKATGEVAYSILLPKEYADEANKDKTYPWALWLPGFGGAGDVIGRGGAQALDRLRGEDKIPAMALVVYNSRRSVYTNGEAAGDTEDVIVGDLLEQLQKKYRLATDRKQRALMGESAGGFGALKIAMRHPGVFGAVAAHSAAILPADPKDLAGMTENIVMRSLRGGLAQEFGDPIDAAKWAAHMPMALAASMKPADLEGLQIYFDAGTEDHYDLYKPNQQLDKVMTEHEIPHVFRSVEGGGHAWSSPSMTDSVAQSLRFVGLALAGKDAVALTKEALAAAAKADAAKDGEGKDKDE
ncbi:MAG: alpha/beta hydrolase-fold protein [Planctomycetota bacterium]